AQMSDSSAGPMSGSDSLSSASSSASFTRSSRPASVMSLVEVMARRPFLSTSRETPRWPASSTNSGLPRRTLALKSQLEPMLASATSAPARAILITFRPISRSSSRSSRIACVVARGLDSEYHPQPMHETKLRKLLDEVREGTKSVDEAREQLSWLPIADLEFARIDHHRQIRQGMPEVVFGEGKTSDQLIRIAGALLEQGQDVLITRVDSNKAEAVRTAYPELLYSVAGRTLRLTRSPPPSPFSSPVAVVT